MQNKQKAYLPDKFLRVMLNSSPHISVLFNSRFQVIDCNSAALEFLGFKTIEDMAAGFMERLSSSMPVHQHDKEREISIPERFMTAAKEGAIDFETELDLNGTIRNVHVKLRKIPNENDFLIAAFVVDMTDFRQRENELAHERELNEFQLTKLKLVVKGSKIGLWDMEVIENDPVNPLNAFNWSDEFRNMLGFSDENDFPNIFSSWSDRLHPDDFDRTLDSLEKHLLDTTGNTPYDIEYRLMMKNEEYAYFRASGETVRDEKGHAIRVAGALMDITETKLMTKALNDAVNESQKTIEIMSSVLNNTDAMLYVSDKDTGKLLFINDSMKNHFNIESDVMGKHCYEVFNLNANERCEWCPCKKLDIDQDEVVVWEERNSLTKRYYRNTDRYIDWPGGKKVHLQHRVELTEIKQVQDELERNQKMLSAVNSAAAFLLNSDTDTFENAMLLGMKEIAQVVEVDRVYIWKNFLSDDKLYCTQISEWSENVEPQQGKDFTRGILYSESIPRWETELSAGNCINNTVRNLPEKEQALFYLQDIVSILIVPIFIKEQFWGFAGFDDCHKERIFTKEEVSILRSASVLLASSWLRTEMVLSLRKTSVQLEFALQQAESANRAKSDFLSTMSHEIRTPMNAILGITEIQLQNEARDQNIKEAFEKIYVSGNLLLGIINDILDLSKIEAGKLELVVENYETASLISDTVQLNIIRIGSKPIEFELSIDENLLSVLSGDELRIKQILNNLLTNAFKYTEAGRVILSVTTEPGTTDSDVTLVLCVSDTGRGMNQEQLEKLFDKFIRFDQDINRTVEGAGLGLSITQNLVELMNGKITVESAPEKGSIFKVYLPQGKVGSSVLGAELANNLRRLRASSRTQIKRRLITHEPMPYGSVLIVDDVETNIYVARGLLTPYGLKIDSVNSGFEAIEKIESGNMYDIVFMDHMMPKMDGIEATKIMRGMGYDNPIVALTANAVAGQADIFLSNGFDGFIAKPIDIRQLNAVLRKFIRDKQSPEVIEAALQEVSQKNETFSVKKLGLPASTRITEAFVRDAVKTIGVLDVLNEKQGPYNEEDKLSYDTNIHGMKSALAHIGKTELSAIAFNLEMSIRDMDDETIRYETSVFADSLRTVVEELAQKNESKINETVDEHQSYLHEKLLVIQAACFEYNEKVIDDAVTQLRKMSWTQSTHKLLETIGKHLLHSDFGEIIIAVNKYLEL